ncbi:MAG: PLP-dependent aminotransferase family protein [Pyrinomonadaceae bacterium]
MMALANLSLKRGNGLNLYRQLVAELERAIEAGELKDGERLPSERQLASQLGISRTTVINSYRDLESRGLVRGHVGRGTFVCARSEAIEAPFAWRGKVSAETALLNNFAGTQDLLRHSTNPDLISFALLSPALECFPANEYQRAVGHVVRKHSTEGFGIGPSEGQPKLRRLLADRLRVRPEQILIVSGAQQGLDLVARCLLDPGDAVIIDRPGYIGAIQNFRAARAKLIGWDVMRSDLGELEDLILRYRPKLICTTPTFQNPTGRTLSLAERQELLTLAARYRVPVIEDDPFRDTALTGSPPPTLFQLDTSNTVIFLGTFSKTLAPGLRLGWLVASEYVVEQLALIKGRQLLFSGGLEQLALAELLENGTYDSHLVRLRAEHLERWQVMKRALEHHIPARSLVFSFPLGGLHFWCRLQDGVSSQQLVPLSLSKGIALASGEVFYADGGAGRNEFRLCFTSVPAEKIEVGIKRLAEAVKAVQSDLAPRQDSFVPLV